MILVIDNYDSFVYNIVQYLGELGAKTHVVRNDAIDVREALELKPTHLLLSPGPCAPDQAGVTLELINAFSAKIPVLGICLGHQAIGQAFGAQVVRSEPCHGKISSIKHDGKGVYQGLPERIRVTRYHSLAIERASLPDCLLVSAQTDDGLIMGLRHRELPIEGVQFHPEAILTEHGHRMLQNFLAI